MKDLYELRYSKEAGEIILAFLYEKRYLLKKLTFDKWHNHNLVAKDDKGFRYVVIGSYWDKGFILRGIVRERVKHRPFTWSLNGQASTGAIQIAHIGEQDYVPSTEFSSLAA